MAKKEQQKEAKFVRFACTVEWAFLNKVNDLSEKYEFDACCLSPKTIEALENMGVEVKVSEKQPDKGAYIKLRSARPIKALDENGDPIEGDSVGNGSKAIVTAGSYEWKFKGKTGVSPSCRKLIITELVEYAGGDVDEEEVEDTL